MTDNDQTPSSGSRWEPADTAPVAAGPTPSPAASAGAPVPGDPSSSPGRRGWRLGARTWLVGATATVALLLAGGLGGFALGQAGDDEGRGDHIELDGFREQFPGRWPDQPAPPPGEDHADAQRQSDEGHADGPVDGLGQLPAPSGDDDHEDG